MNARRPSADRTMMCAFGNLSIAALRLEALRDRAELLAGHTEAFHNWNQKVGQVTELFERIQLSIIDADHVGNTLPVQLGNGAHVPADAAYLDRLTERLLKLQQIGILRGYSDTAHALVGQPQSASISTEPLAAAS
jgi:hypothetical protein